MCRSEPEQSSFVVHSGVPPLPALVPPVDEPPENHESLYAEKRKLAEATQELSAALARADRMLKEPQTKRRRQPDNVA